MVLTGKHGVIFSLTFGIWSSHWNFWVDEGFHYGKDGRLKVKYQNWVEIGFECACLQTISYANNSAFFFRYNIKSVNHQRLNVVLRFYDTLCVPPWSKVMNYDVLYWSQPKKVLKYLNIQIFSQNQSDRNWKRRQNLYEIWLDYDLHATRIWAMFSLAAKR